MKQNLRNAHPAHTLAALALACSLATGCGNIENPDEEAARPEPSVRAESPAPKPKASPAASPQASAPKTSAAAPTPAVSPAPVAPASPPKEPVVRTATPPPAPAPVAPEKGMEARALPAAASTAPVREGLELRLAHCAYFPAAGSGEHKLARFPENPSNSASPVSEYEVLAGLDNTLFYAKTVAEFDEKDIASAEPGTTGLSGYVTYRLSETGARKLREATEKVAATNNAVGNGNGRLLFVRDGRVVLAFSLGRANANEKFQGFPATNTPNTISIDAESFSDADAQVSAFTRRNGR